MTILDFIISICVFALAIRLLWEKFKSHPSDKYHNESWKNRKSGH